MRVAVNLEFTDDELRKFAEDVGRRWTLGFIHESLRHINELKLDPSLSKSLQQACAMGLAAAMNRTEPPPDVGPIAADATFEPDPPPTKCVAIYADGRSEFDDGWICHRCRAYNGLRRDVCRTCSHDRCDVIVTPPPGEGDNDPNVHSGSA